MMQKTNDRKRKRLQTRLGVIFTAIVFLLSSSFGNLTFLAGSASAAEAADTGIGITIGSYNVLTDRWGGSGYSNRAGKIAKNIKSLGMDVVALQEFESARGANKIISALGSDWEVLKDNGGAPARDGFGLAYAWNTTKVKKISEESKVNVSAGASCGGGSSTARIVHFQTVGGKDFYLGNHHGRINRSNSCSEARTDNITKIIKKLDQLANSTTPALLAGDTNSWPSDAHGGIYSTVRDLKWANADESAKEKSGGTSKIDRIFYSPATISAPSSFKRSSCETSTSGNSSCGSDHKPVAATFEASESDVPLTIGTYNILGYYHGEGSKYNSKRLDQIVKNINDMQYDVVGLQEYSDQKSGDAKELENRLKALNPAWSMSYAPTTKGDPDQLNYVYNTGTVQLINDRSILAGKPEAGCDGGTVYARIAKFVVSATGREFMMINVHPTSNHKYNRCDTERLSVIKGALADSEVAAYTGPLFFVGDFNANPTGKRRDEGNIEKYLTSVGYDNARDIPGAIRKEGGVIDHIYYKTSSISPPTAFEVLGCTNIPEGDPTLFKPSMTCASDHYPVKAVFGGGAKGCGNYDAEQYAAWDILFYNPSCTCSESSSMSGDTNFEKIATYFSSKGLKDVAIAGILANLQNESRLTPFAVQGQPNNTPEHKKPPEGPRDGYGIAQFTPATKISKVLKEDSRTAQHFEQYYSTKYGGYAVKAWNEGGTGVPDGVPVEVNDAWLETQLDFFYKGEMQSTKVGTYRNLGGTMGLDYIEDDYTILEALNAAKNEKDAARIFVWIYERPLDKPGAASGREKVATDMLAAVQGAIGGSSTAGTSSAGCGNTESTGDFVSAVKAFVWEDGRRGSKQKEAYTKALEGRYKGGNNGNDCGAFVSALMVKSGFEPDYPGTDTAGQKTWLDKNWEKIAGVGEVDVSELKPGDVGVVAGSHVFVWIGTIEGFKGKSAEAALSSNTAPTVILDSNTFSAPSKYTWYRKKE